MYYVARSAFLVALVSGTAALSVDRAIADSHDASASMSAPIAGIAHLEGLSVRDVYCLKRCRGFSSMETLDLPVATS